MADAAQRDVTRGLAPRVLASWWAPRRVVRGLAGLPERALLVVLMLAMLIFLIAQAPVNARAAYLDPSVPMAARMAGSAMAVIFILPLIAYALAALVAAVVRLTPWRLTGRASRLALFWALLAVAPAMLLAGLVGGLIGSGPALVLTQAVAGIGFVVIWGAGIAATVTK